MLDVRLDKKKNDPAELGRSLPLIIKDDSLQRSCSIFDVDILLALIMMTSKSFSITHRYALVPPLSLGPD